MSYHKIQASEITTYVYCQRAWWLQRVRGHASGNVRAVASGKQYHEAHGRTVQQSFWTRRLAYALLFIAVAIITFQILVEMWGV